MTVPKYAQGVTSNKRVKIVCKGKCGSARYAEVSRVDWSKTEHSDDLHATCLMCGHRAQDNYNWYKE